MLCSSSLRPKLQTPDTFLERVRTTALFPQTWESRPSSPYSDLRPWVLGPSPSNTGIKGLALFLYNQSLQALHHLQT